MSNNNTFIGVDLHKKTCYITVMDYEGKIEKQIEILDKQYQLEVKVDNPFGSCFCKKPDVLQQFVGMGLVNIFRYHRRNAPVTPVW